MGEKIKNNNKEKKGAFKFIKIILIIYIAVLIFWFLINNYMKDDKTIYDKIGSMYPYSATTKEALNIKLYGILQYRDYILNDNLEAAYDMLTEEYKNYMPYDEYVESLDGIDFNTFDLKEAKVKSTGSFVLTVTYLRNGVEEEDTYLAYYHKNNPKLISLSPNSFIYTFKDLKLKVENTEFYVEECDVFINNIVLKGNIKNTSLFEEATYDTISVGYGEGVGKNYKEEFTLGHGESKDINLTFETEYFIPNNIRIRRILDDDTLRTYTMYFKDAK